MAFSSSVCFSRIRLQADRSGMNLIRPRQKLGVNQGFSSTFKNFSTELCGEQFVSVRANFISDWSFIGGSKVTFRPGFTATYLCREVSGVYASFSPVKHLKKKSLVLTSSGLTSSQIATSSFTLGTAAVLPFYTLMVLFPKAQITKNSMQSSIPYVLLGLLYVYLLYLSWTPDTIRLMFASKYWLPELPGIAKMFSKEMTLVSAWIHLLSVDLFAARQVYMDGLENQIETRHSVSLCLLFCPIGIIVHAITKTLKGSATSGRAECQTWNLETDQVRNNQVL